MYVMRQAKGNVEKIHIHDREGTDGERPCVGDGKKEGAR
jgi:hypothetical protein